MENIRLALPIKTTSFVIALLACSAAWADPVRTEWSAVEQIDPGRKVTVKFYADEPFEGALVVKGRFESANASGITLYLENGETRTLPMRAVRKVNVRRPFAKRIPGWRASTGRRNRRDLAVRVVRGDSAQRPKPPSSPRHYHPSGHGGVCALADGYCLQRAPETSNPVTQGGPRLANAR